MRCYTDVDIIKGHAHYWLREDYDALMQPPPAGPAPKYPQTTQEAARELYLRGLECDAFLLVDLAERRVVRPAGEAPDLQWHKADIDTAAEWLYEHGYWDSWTHFCWVCNLRFGQAVEAHREAAAQCGQPIPVTFDVFDCVFTVAPARNAEGYATIQFFPRGTILRPAVC